MEKIKKYLSQMPWLAVVLATIILCIVFSSLSPAFLQFSNFQAVLVQSSITGIMAVGMSFVIMTSGIDISVGAILLLTATVFAYVFQGTQSFAIALASAIATAIVTGAVNGYLVYRFKMAPMITTLATFNVFRGIAIHISKAQNVPIPREYCFLGNGKIADIPIPLIIFLCVFVVGYYLLAKTRFGTYVKAIGNSIESAKETNLPVKRTLIGAYLLAGLTAGISGILLLSRTSGLQNGMGIGLDFTVIAAVVLGGTKLSGGSGTIIGSVIGAIFLMLIDNGLNLIQASPYIYDAVRGLVLLAAVIVDRVSVSKQEKTLLEQKAERINSAILK